VTKAISSRRVPLRVTAAIAFAVVVTTVGAGSVAAQTGEPPAGQPGGQTSETTLPTYPTISTVTTLDPCGHGSAPAVCDTSPLDGEAGSDSGSLPFSGGDAALVTIVGLGAVGAGVAIVRLSRRRTTGS
jgi:hypothetical protein